MKSIIIIVVLLFCASAKATKLNYPRVLLPIFDKLSINFSLEVLERGGCYKWTSSRLDLIQITSQYDENNEECAHKALVTVLSREKRRNTAIVLAEDLSTGEILRCDVILDVIQQLGVLTTTRELYLEEAPETFELWAQDSQGNAFTTLEGIEFNWQILSQNDGKATSSSSWQQVLKFLTFSESKYHDVPKSIEKIELQNLRGYMVLLEGINTGTATVAVKLPYSEYSAVPPVEVEITVLANLLIDPLDAYILAGDSINFRILQLKQGKLYEITQNSQYYLEIEDTKIATIRFNTATGDKLGQTYVVLRDRNVPKVVKSNSAAAKASTPRASLTVVVPHKLVINLLPYYNWVTVEGELHDIALDLYSVNEQKITLGSRYRINSDFDKNLFSLIGENRNGSRVSGLTVSSGVNPVSGVFEKLSAEAEMIIHPVINLVPSFVMLPLDPNCLKKQKLQFHVSGGDGSFTWSSQNANIMSVAQNGLAETRTENFKDITFRDSEKSVRATNIKVAMSRNVKIFKTSEVIFLPPVKLQIVSYNFETTLKDYVVLHVALYANYNNSLTAFTACDNLQFDFEFSNQIFFVDTAKTNENIVKPLNGACNVIHLKSTHVGDTTLKLSYKFFDNTLMDEVILNVFDKLNIFNPTSNEIVLPIGASRNVIYSHGPEKMYNLEAELTRKVVFQSNAIDVVEIPNSFSKDKHIYNILCKIIGDYTVNLKFYNMLNSRYTTPYFSEFVTKVFCVKPRFINLYTPEKLRDSCPLERKKQSLMHVKTNDDFLEIDVEILDANNRKLDNISSLVIDWQISQDGKDSSKIRYSRKTATTVVEGVPIPKRDYLLTSISNIDMNFKIKGIVTKYNSAVLQERSVHAEVPNFGIQKQSTGPIVTPVIENELNFLSVNRTLLPFDSLSMFLSLDKVRRIKIGQGSGFYEIKMSIFDVVDVVYDDKLRELLITAQNVGDVRIEITDKCLMTDPSVLHVSVVSIGRIDLQVPDRVEKLKHIEAIVQIYDSNNNLLTIDYDNLQYYNLAEEIFNPNILGVKLGNQNNLNLGEVRYIVTGNELGETKMLFNSVLGDNIISSQPSSIQVFPPLTLYPRNVTILLGSSIQIYSKGGPSPDVNIVYDVQHGDILSMDSNIVLGMKLGESRVTGRCVGINPSTRKQLVFSEDSIHITVVPLNMVKIQAPLVRIKMGAVMPATVWAMPNISPMILGTLEDIKIYWSTDNREIIELKDVFEEMGVKYSENNALSIRVKALSPGVAKLHVVVLTSVGLRYSSTVEVNVFKILELESPKQITYDSIIIPPKAAIQLKANINDVKFELDYDEASSIKVSRDGMVRSSEAIGRNLVIASSVDQTLSIPIEVKNIHYIMASLQTSHFQLKQYEKGIPFGLNFAMKISLHDNVGNELSHSFEILNSLGFKLSKQESLDINFGNNYTIGINLLQETTTVMMISLKDNSGVKYSEDFIKTAVGTSKNLYPVLKKFSVGDIICFESPLTGASIEWSSSDDSVINIDKNTGFASILSTNSKYNEKVSVRHGNPKLGTAINYNIEVRDADKIEFVKNYDIFNGESYSAYLIIKNHGEIDKLTNLKAKNVSTCIQLAEKFVINSFTCHLYSKQNQNILNHYKTYPVFDKPSGTYACQIELLTSVNDITNLIQNNDYNIQMEVKLSNGISDILTLKFIPAVFVTPSSLSIEEISDSVISINGLEKVLQNVNVKSSNPSVLDVFVHSKSSNALAFKLRLLSTIPADEELSLEVSSPMTHQNIVIPITSRYFSPKCSTSPLGYFSYISKFIPEFGLLITVVVFIVGAITCAKTLSNQRIQPQNGVIFSPFKSTSPNKIQPSFAQQSPYMSSPSTSGSPFKSNRSMSPNRSLNASANLSDSDPIYGDPTLVSPQIRNNRRFI